MSLTTATLLKYVFDATAGISLNIVSTKLLEKFQQDLFQVISGMVLEEHRKFKSEFPEAALPLKATELRPAIEQHFGQLTAAQIDDPLSEKALEILFMNFFLKAENRQAENFDSLDPQIRNALRQRAQTFKRVFPAKFTAACERNNVAATRLMLASLAQTGKNETEVKATLKAIQEAQLDLPAQFSQIIEMQLVPFIQQQIMLVMNRFHDWEFAVEFLQGKKSETTAAEKEWLEVLAQVLEWKNFKEIKRSPLDGIPGLMFRMVKEDELGILARWVCWGCPTEDCPTESLLRQVVTHLREENPDKMFVISRNNLSVELVRVLEKHGIVSHLTLEQFLQTSLKITTHQQNKIAEYEKKSIFHNFINLNCHRRSHEKEALDLRNQFMAWLQNDSTRHISLLGNFGTGKTVFCERMQYELLKNYQPRDRIPVLLTLRELKGIKLEDLISKIMNRMGLKHLDYPAFRTLNRLGKFVVLIDGFDEMATYATLNEMRENFLELAVLAEGRAKVMLTCRTHYFEDVKKEDEVLSLPEFIAERPEFKVLYLNPLTRDQIETYLDRVRELYHDKQEVLNRMDALPRLRELMEIPVLLDMILGIFDKLIHYGEALTLANVYDEAVNNWAHSEKKKGNLKNLSVPEVLAFMRELAWQMHEEQEFKVNFKKLRSRTKDKFHERLQIDYRDLDAFFGEIRTCTFLTRDLLGDYSFAHKSFMEYFTARHLAPLLQNHTAPETVMNEEIRQFIYQTLENQVNYRSDAFRFQDDLPAGLWRKADDPFTFIHEKDGSEMVWIPPGPFICGGDYDGDERPIRIHRLEAGGFLDKFLVSNAQYARFLNETGRFESEWIDLRGEYKKEKCRIQRRKNDFMVETGYENHPVNFVRVAGAEAYADWVGKRLPSEWLWEKAGRGIDGRNYPWGDDWDWQKCNSADFWKNKKSSTQITPTDFFIEFISPFGCTDLSGNLWEWMRERWKKDSSLRVVRGGGFFYDRGTVRLASRGIDLITYLSNDQGFRLSRTF